MKKILSLIKIDFANALRDNIILYIFIAPLLIAGGLRLFLPSLEGSVIRFALHVPQNQGTVYHNDTLDFKDKLSSFGIVETYENLDKLKQRVLSTDSVGGFARDEKGEWQILLEGNEAPKSLDLMQSIYHSIISETRIGNYSVSRGEKRSPVMEYASVGIIMLAALIGGLAVSFTMIEEKEQNVTKAFSVTPLKPFHYFVARGILAALIGFFIAWLGDLILTGSLSNLTSFLLALLATAPLPLMIVLLIGGIAKNQIQALAVLKIVMMLYFALPFSSIFISGTWQWIYYPFPNYWMFRTLSNLYVAGGQTGDFLLSAGITFITGILYLLVLGLSLGKQLKPR